MKTDSFFRSICPCFQVLNFDHNILQFYVEAWCRELNKQSFLFAFSCNIGKNTNFVSAICVLSTLNSKQPSYDKKIKTMSHDRRHASVLLPQRDGRRMDSRKPAWLSPAFHQGSGDDV